MVLVNYLVFHAHSTMSMLFRVFFQTNAAKVEPPLKPLLATDLNSCLLPGFGADDLQQSLTLMSGFRDMGMRKVILTPSVMKHYYERSAEEMQVRVKELADALQKKKIELTLHLAAKYYLDDYFFGLLRNAEPLLLLDRTRRHVLVETSFVNQKNQLFAEFETILAAGYQPVLAHPERYSFLSNDLETLKQMRQKGVLFQLNLTSLMKETQSPMRIMAERLIENELISYVSSDCYSSIQIPYLAKALSSDAFKQLHQQGLLNNVI